MNQTSFLEPLNREERNILLTLARQAIEFELSGKPLPQLDGEQIPSTLKQPGASFVTLTRDGELRGCVGTLEPYQSLVEDVREHALAAAFEDYRFPPLRADELPRIKIEISRLTPPQDFQYESSEDLIAKLTPFRDGVTLFDGIRRATFLPQVWEKLPEPEEFLDHLCMKMGTSPDLWRKRKLRVQIYQVEEFHE